MLLCNLIGAGRAVMDGKSSFAVEAGAEIPLEEFANLARQLIVLIDRLPSRAALALDVAGWDSGHAFALRAELGRVAECAEKARRDTARAIARR
jgi:hypothetical protein